MNDEELKKLWQQQPLREPVPATAQLISAMQTQTRQLRGILDARDLRELLACAVVMIVFGGFAYSLHVHQPISRLGDWIVIASSIFIAGKLIYTRWTTPAAPPDATIVEGLQAELNAVRAQSRLLGSVLWWYLLPLFVGLLVMTWGGLPIHDPVSLLMMIPANLLITLFFIAVNVFIYRVNQQERATRLLPLEAQLESLLHSAETGEPLDEVQIAELRPLAHSLSADDQVKPVEFKVAFWQIALWGEVGFIGIWIFLMVALAIGNAERKSAEQGQAELVAGIRVEETARYSVVAQKVVDLLNGGNYSAVQTLYNADMRKAFPPQQASEFLTKLMAGFGRIEKFEGPIGSNGRGWIAFRLHSHDGESTMSLALDANDNISGLYFKPAAGGSPSFQSFFHRPIGPLHLALIVPFFLAGLLYSWVIQKMTERAVGISTRGVHLNQGQNLIRWDEIKEIRPLRVLNIRSLWLIRKSGEKTIMPWSSLERPSDLKAAVEGLAPANHPIHTYLSLLRRT